MYACKKGDVSRKRINEVKFPRKHSRLNIHESSGISRFASREQEELIPSYLAKYYKCYKFTFPRSSRSSENFKLSNEVEADSDLHSRSGDWNEFSINFFLASSLPNLAYEYVKRTIKFSRQNIEQQRIFHAMFRLYFQI